MIEGAEDRAVRSKTAPVNLLAVPRSDYVFFSLSVGGQLFDVIMFDVDNKDSTVGMSGPPPAFVETLILQKVCNLLTPRGTVFLTIYFPPFAGICHILYEIMTVNVCICCRPHIGTLIGT